MQVQKFEGPKTCNISVDFAQLPTFATI